MSRHKNIRFVRCFLYAGLIHRSVLNGLTTKQKHFSKNGARNGLKMSEKPNNVQKKNWRTIAKDHLKKIKRNIL